MDVDSLLRSHGEESPSGEDLEYDADFTEMEIAAQPGPELQNLSKNASSDAQTMPGEDPDYKEVASRAMSILERSHDVRAAVFLAEAQLKLKGLPAFAQCTTYLRRCLEEYWASCHPQLDADDDNDPTMRVNAVFALADPTRTLRALRNAPLSSSRMLGNFSLRQMQLADGEVQPTAQDEPVADKATVRAALEDTDKDQLVATADAVATALADVKAINAKFSAETPGRGPDLDPLVKLLHQMNVRLRDVLGADAPAAEGEGVAEADGEAAPAAAAGGGRAAVGIPGAINSRTDVTAALERLIGYYERNEPSSPVPILLQRAKKLVNADFLTIMKDMAPLGVENVHLIGGIENEDE